MNPRAPALEKALHRRVCREIKSDPALKRAWQRAQQRRGSWVLNHFLGSLLFLAFPAMLAVKFGSLTAAMAFAALSGTLLGLSLGPGLRSGLRESEALAVFAPLPIGDGDIFRVLWRWIWRSSFWWTGPFLVFLLFKFGADWTPWTWLAVIAWALLQGQVLFATGALAGAFLPAFLPLGGLAALVWMGGMVLFVIQPATMASIQGPLESANHWIEVCLPSGWVNYVFQHGVVGKETHALVMLIPVLVFFGSMRQAYQKYLADFEMPRFGFTSDGPREEIESGIAAATGADPSTEPAGLDQAGLRDEIRNCLGSTPPPIPAHLFIERWVWRWLTPTQQTMAEFFLANPPLWTRWFFRALKLLVALLLALWFWPSESPWRPWVMILGIGLVWVVGTPLLGGSWGALEIREAFGTQIPLCAYYPVGYPEFVPVYLKCNGVRLLVFTPVALVGGAILGFIYPISPWAGSLLSLKLALATALWLPAILLFPFSLIGGSNESTQITWKNIFLLMSQVLLILAAGVSGAFLVFVPSLASSVLWLCLMALSSAGSFAHWRWAYNRAKFDLTSLVRS